MNRIRLYWHRILRKPAITEPMRIYTRRIPDGLLLDFEDYFTYVVTTIADDPNLLDQFMEMVEDRATSREHDGWKPEQLLVEKLATAVGYEVPVRGKALRQLADRLHAAAPAPVAAVPAQRRQGGAAA
ncbi:hypothetical protein [Streptomyces sp. NRRL S-1022]|uniref:hypothetical protein n=1 Tax=Streptomyces sp. NRRL S-1022 TaxID=1463880 RepID=UPI0004C256F9|nr:hypothetical protein [Streptomyces sp. NRRL S-1022]